MYSADSILSPVLHLEVQLDLVAARQIDFRRNNMKNRIKRILHGAGQLLDDLIIPNPPWTGVFWLNCLRGIPGQAATKKAISLE
jgi:hypothetical protein